MTVASTPPYKTRVLPFSRKPGHRNSFAGDAHVPTGVEPRRRLQQFVPRQPWLSRLQRVSDLRRRNEPDDEDPPRAWLARRGLRSESPVGSSQRDVSGYPGAA